MIQELFVDMDGVVANFHSRFESLFKQSALVDYNDSNTKKKKQYQKNFHQFIMDKNFSKLEPMPDFNEAIEFLEWINIEHKIPVCFLTSTAREEYLNEISSQKKEWLKTHNVRFNAMFVPGKRYKCYYSKPNRILIDDTRQNIDDWILGGGIGIFHTSWKDSIAKVKELL